jgi:hypothetical protein
MATIFHRLHPTPSHFLILLSLISSCSLLSIYALSKYTPLSPKIGVILFWGFVRGSLRSVLLAFSQPYLEHDLRKNKIVILFFC